MIFIFILGQERVPVTEKYYYFYAIALPIPYHNLQVRSYLAIIPLYTEVETV